MSPPRILLYSHDGFGLGHLRRNSNVAEALVAARPDASALLLAGFSGVPGVALPDGVDLVKLPSVRKVATRAWSPRTLRVPRSSLAALRRSLISATFRAFEPDLVLVDYMPAGVWGELVPPLEELRRQRPHARVVLGLRDILDAPEVSRRAWAQDGHGDAVRRLYDRIIVYGSAEVFDADAAYGLSEWLPGRVQHVGYACATGSGAGSADLRARLGIGAGERLVLVAAGGGADAFPMMSLVLDALRELPASAGVHALAITGPLMPPECFARLERAAAADPRIRVRHVSGDLTDVMASADALVTMAGYNTLCEGVRLGLPVLVVPRAGPSAEQAMRARLFAERGLVRVAQPGDDPADVAIVLADMLARRPRLAPHGLDFTGLERTASILEALLPESSAAPATVEATEHGA